MDHKKENNSSVVLEVDNIPLSKQGDNYSCVAHCIWMVIQYFAQNLGHTVPDLPVDEITKTIKATPELATDLDDLERINEPLKKANPILTFYPEVDYPWERVLAELREKKPVIAWIKENLDPYVLAHSVVIRKFDPQKGEVIYIDPQEGEQTMYIGRFLELWANAYNILIPIKVGEVLQTRLDLVLKKE